VTVATHRRHPEYFYIRNQEKTEQYAGRLPLAPLQAANDPAEDAAAAEPARGRGRVEEDQLVVRAQAGQAPAFEALVNKYRNKVVQLVARLVGEADAQDVAQETFIKAYRALGGFRGQSAFYTWLYRVAVNSAKNHLVARGRRPLSQDIDVADAEAFGHSEQLSDVATPESILLSQEMEHKLATVIKKLPSDLRRAIVLRELEGLSYDEIAEVMDCPIGTVRSRIFRARESIDAVVDAQNAV
jgi:RNA polymerase sigma-70 factor, ECF subfamily